MALGASMVTNLTNSFTRMPNSPPPPFEFVAYNGWCYGGAFIDLKQLFKVETLIGIYWSIVFFGGRIGAIDP